MSSTFVLREIPGINRSSEESFATNSRAIRKHICTIMITGDIVEHEYLENMNCSISGYCFKL